MFSLRFLCVYARDHLSMYLKVLDTHKLRPGWKRRVSFCFVLLNQSGKELFRSPGNELDYVAFVVLVYLILL